MPLSREASYSAASDDLKMINATATDAVASARLSTMKFMVISQ
jgi:hypothetical protein